MYERFLLLALEQAKLGQGLCAPNPCVGAIAVQNGAIIAQAWHQGAGSPHAEQLLLAQFPPKTPGVTVYCTLEPCNHWGRTPPCVDALMQHQVEKVVYAYADPNPLVANGKSTELLRAQGIVVEHITIPEIDAFYESYTYWIKTKRPKVTVKMAQTFDGAIGGSQGERIQLSNALCGVFTQEQRAVTDVILTTARTVNLDNPKMNVRLNASIQSKPVAIIDSNLSIKADSQIFSSARHCHIYHLITNKVPPRHPERSEGSPEIGIVPYDRRSLAALGMTCEQLANKIHYDNSSFYQITEKNGKMDLAAVITHLGSLGFHDVWVEAGGALFTALHVQGLVHRTYLYLVPKNLGPKAISAYQQPGIFDRAHTITWQAMDDNMIACIDWQEVACSPG